MGAPEGGPARPGHRPDPAPAPLSPGVYLLRNVASGLVLEVPGGSKGSGAKVRQGPAAAGAAAQQWQLAPVHSGGGLYHLVNVHSGKRLDVTGASTENGATVQQWKANNYGAQEWIVERLLGDPTRNDVVVLVSWVSGLLLEVADGSLAEGAGIRQWEDTDSPSQWWRLEPVTPAPGAGPDPGAGQRPGGGSG
ncbi:RICIN domain-containing protein [Streptomyces sp. NBC_00239]|uniref:RICIN domain-containing protein n=1 Tax=Streptomyces sp. NBC_00239 TaxID=2903640 RepID=UPI002E2E53A2|nr:RICIN domain-containing protein [Streptomyces sp. NBC_00239]